MLQSYLHRLTDGHAVRGHLAVHGQDVDASGCGLPQGLELLVALDGHGQFHDDEHMEHEIHEEGTIPAASG